MVIELTAMAPTGESIGRSDGLVIFVPFGVSGDVVDVEIVHRRRTYAIGKLLRIIMPAPERDLPVCSYFTHCGGCEWQHIQYETQLRLKTQIVKEQLQRVGKFPDACVRPCITSTNPYHYRNHTQFVLSQHDRPGYYARNSKSVIEVKSCPIITESLNNLLEPMTYESLNVLSLLGQARTHGQLDTVRELHLRSGTYTGEDSVFIEQLDGSIITLGGGETIHERIGPFTYQVSPASFFQINTPVAELLVQQVITSLELAGTENVLDLYCGVGMFTLPVSMVASSVLGVEANPTATSDAVRNVAHRPNVDIVTADVNGVLQSANISARHWDAVIVDPPRSGLPTETRARLANLRAQIVVYVSCDPATLARDAHDICSHGYRLVMAQPYDMFPQTHHVETLAQFKRQ